MHRRAPIEYFKTKKLKKEKTRKPAAQSTVDKSESDDDNQNDNDGDEPDGDENDEVQRRVEPVHRAQHELRPRLRLHADGTSAAGGSDQHGQSSPPATMQFTELGATREETCGIASGPARRTSEVFHFSNVYNVINWVPPDEIGRI